MRWILGAMRACAATMASQVGGWKLADSTDGTVLMRLTLGPDALGSFARLACPLIMRSWLLLKRHYGMLEAVASEAQFGLRKRLKRVLVSFGHLGLVLDRPPHSVRLEAPLQRYSRMPAVAVSARWGRTK